MPKINLIDQQLDLQVQLKQQQLQLRKYQEEAHKARQIKWWWVSNTIAIFALVVAIWPYVHPSREQYHDRITINALQMRVNELEQRLDDLRYQVEAEKSKQYEEMLKEPGL